MATVKYTVKDNWGSGFIGNMTVDGGTSGVHGWTIEFDAGFAITNIWGAEIVSRVGTHYVLRNASYNGDVSAGGSGTFGFQATPGATGGTAATGLTLNGAGEEPPPSLPTISVGDASVVEGNSGTVQMNFTVSLSKAASGPVTVAYATADGTATAGSDYVARSGTITFAAGETQKTISVTVNGDKVAELNETLALRLSSPSGATIADGAAVGTITTDEAIVPRITIADATIKEGDGGTRDLAFTITLSEATTAPVSVTYGTEDGTAKAGLDYVAQTGTVTFAPGETSKVINIKVSGDTAIEGNETLKINLTGATGGKIADRLAVGTIVNDDATISIAPFLYEMVGKERRVSAQKGITMNVNVLRSESTGSVHIKSADPHEPPAIRFNFLSTEHDRTGIVNVLRKGRELMATSPLKEVTGREIAPGAHLQSDAELLEWVRNNAETTYHPVGTCKMGNDPRAVVDPELRVHGLTGLRVADASIMPTLTSGNTNAPTIMIGEKCAAMILATAATARAA